MPDLASQIAERRRRVLGRIAAAAQRAGRSADDVTLVAVTKTHAVDVVRAAVAAGLTDLGENRVQELVEKSDAVPGRAQGGDVRWHVIGSLQRNKARDVAARADLFHALDSPRLARALDKKSADAGRVLDVLVQVNISGEDSKSGVAPEAAHDLVALADGLPHLRVTGLMGMAAPAASAAEAERVVRPAFARLRELFDASPVPLRELSMGMSGDFEVAVEEGATLVRVGSALFGRALTERGGSRSLRRLLTTADMKLTPLDIKRHTFEKGFRGYDPAEVDGFLKQVADQFESLQEDLRLAHERTRETESKLQHYERVEMALQEALESAKASAQRTEEDTARRSAVILEEAELRAQQILQDAERERFGMRQDLVRLSSRQAEVAARLRGFLMSELEVLSDFQGNAPSGLLQMSGSDPLRLESGGQDASPVADAAPDARPEATASEVEAAPAEPSADAASDSPDRADAAEPSAPADSDVHDDDDVDLPGAAELKRMLADPEALSGALEWPEPAAEPAMPNPPYAPPAAPAPRVEISSRAGEDALPIDDSEVLGPATPVEPSPATPDSAPDPFSAGGWSPPSDASVSASEAERERIRRILEDLD